MNRIDNKPVDRRRRLVNAAEVSGTNCLGSNPLTVAVPSIPSPSSNWDDRLTTPEEIELSGSTRRRQHQQQQRSILLIPARATSSDYDDDEDEEDSSFFSEDLNDGTPLLLGTDGEDAADFEDGEQILVEMEEDEEDIDFDDDDCKNQKYRNNKPLRIFRFARLKSISKRKEEEIDVEQYMAKREMTKQQEHWNAYTMVPSPLYCLYFLLAGLWVKEQYVEQARNDLQSAAGGATDFIDDSYSSYCLNMQREGSDGTTSSSLWISFLMRFTSLPAVPPLPVVAAAMAIVVHAPFSFIYHYKYAHSLPPGLARTTHWSRRMDQAMIHTASALMSYGTSGSLDFFIANVLYNADCIYRLFQKKVRPKQNKIRIGISCLAYTMPILRRGDFVLFFELWFLLAVAGWLFGQYPIGGWSHAVFHLVMAFVPPLLMTAACDLPASQERMRIAAQCVALAEKMQR